MRTDFLHATGDDIRIAHSARMGAQIQEGFRLAEERHETRCEREAETRADTVTARTTAILAEVGKLSAAELKAKVDLHHYAVIEALMENSEALDAARRELDLMLAKAHVLEDGRRVFKTEDGRRVFDEFGQEVAPEEISADDIDDGRPRWEQFGEVRERHDAIVEQRRELLDYQRRLDDADERLANGNLTQDDLAELDRLLADDVPEAVRRHLPSGDSASLQRDRDHAQANQRPDNAAAFTHADVGRGGSNLTSGLSSFDFN